MNGHFTHVGDKANNSALRPICCDDCDLNGYELQAADLTSGQKNPDPNDKNTSLGRNNIFDDEWNVSGIERGTYELYLFARCFAGNSNKGFWDSKTAVARGDTEDNNGGTLLCEEYKYKVKLDNEDYVNVGPESANYIETGIDDSHTYWTNVPMATLNVEAGTTKLTLHNMNNGYTIWIFAIRLIKVA